MAMSRKDRDEVEAIMDKGGVGVRGLLRGLSEIAYEKADHVASAWQDRRLARRWEALAKKFAEQAEKVNDPYGP